MKKILESRKELPKSDSQKNQGQGGQTKEDEDKQTSETKSNEAGSVIVDRVNETLEMLLKQWESRRLKLDTPFPPKLLEYPDPLQEKIDLIRNQQLIRDTQTTFEGPPAHILRSPKWTRPELETIQEVADTEEDASVSKSGD